MTVQLDWPANVVKRLTDEAQRIGVSLDAYLLETVLNQNVMPASQEDAAARRRAAAEQILQFAKGKNIRGATVRELIDDRRWC
jgi:hypothetical protein